MHYFSFWHFCLKGTQILFFCSTTEKPCGNVPAFRYCESALERSSGGALSGAFPVQSGNLLLLMPPVGNPTHHPVNFHPLSLNFAGE